MEEPGWLLRAGEPGLSSVLAEQHRDKAVPAEILHRPEEQG